MRFAGTVTVFTILNLCVWVAYHHWISPRRDLLRIEASNVVDGALVADQSYFSWRFTMAMVAEPGPVLDTLTPGIITPTLAGEWEWTDQRTLRFTPAETLPRAQNIAVSLRADRLSSRDGFRLPADVSGLLRGTPLRFVNARQSGYESGDRHLIELVFTDRVLPAELLKHVELRDDDGVPIACEVIGASTSASSPELRGGSILRLLTESLQGRSGGDDRHVTLRLSPGLVGINGPLGIENEVSASLSLTPALRLHSLSSTSPSSGNPRIYLHFNQGVDPVALKRVLVIEPAVPFVLTQSGSTTILDGAFIHGQRYAVTISAPPLKKNEPVLRYPSPDTQAVAIADRRADCWFEHRTGYLGAQGNRTLVAHTVNVNRVTVEVSRVYDSNLVQWRTTGQIHRTERLLATRVIVPASAKNTVADLRLSLDDLLKEHGAEGVYRVVIRADHHDITSVDGDDEPWYRYDRLYGEAVVSLSDIAVSARQGADGLMAWAMSLSSAKPIPGVRLRLFSNRNQPIGEAVTDSDGLAHIARAVLPGDEAAAVLIADRGNDAGKPSLTWLDVGQGQLRDNAADTGGRTFLRTGHEAFIYTDRGVYRPGDVAQVRAIVRGPDGAVPSAFPVRWRILRPDLREWQVRMQPIDADGCVDLKLDLPADLVSGRWTIQLGLPGDSGEVFGSTAIRIEDFIPERLAVGVDHAGPGIIGPEAGNRRYHVAAGPLVVTARGDYLFGQPAAGREARLVARLDPTTFITPAFANWTFGDQAGVAAALQGKERIGRRIETKAQPLDAQGRTTWSLSLADELSNDPGPWLLTTAASVVEVGGRAVNAGRTIAIDRAAYYVGARFTGVPRVGEPCAFAVQLARSDGTPALVDAQFIAQLYHEVWNTVLLTENGQYRYTSQRRLDPLGDPLPVAIVHGVGTGAVALPAGGSYVLWCGPVQGGPQTTCASLACYASSFNAWDDSISRERPERCEVLVRRAGTPADAVVDGTGRVPVPVFAAGDALEVVVRSPFPGRVLITVETDRVVATRSLDLTQAATTVPLVVDAAWKPNAYITATVVRPVDPAVAWRVHRAYGVTPVLVAQPERQALIAISAPSDVRTGSTLSASLIVSDAGGSPLADAAVTVVAVDEGILRLTAFPTPDPFTWFIAKRSLGVHADDAYRDLMPEVARPAGESPVGGDGGPGGPRYRTPITAKRVRPVALWSDVLRSDNTGVVRVELPLPATFNGKLRLMAVASKAAVSGSAAAEIIVRAPVVVQTSWPRFAAPGDRFEVPVTVFNRSATAGTVRIAMQVAGSAVGTPLLASDQPEFTAAIPAHGETTVRLPLTVAGACGVAAVTITARIGDESAIDEVELPVRPGSPAIAEGGEVVVATGKPARIDVAAGMLPGDSQSVQVVVAPQATLAIPRGLDYLYRYPHGCAEQTVSGCFPLIALRDLLAGISPTVYTQAGITARLQVGINRLRAMETSDGGIATWIGYSSAWPWASVYAAHFLIEAKIAGQPVDEGFLQRLLAYVRRLNDRSGDTWTETQAYACYVLALAGRPDLSAMQRLSERRDLAPAIGLHLAAAWLAAGRRDRASGLIPAQLPDQVRMRHLDGDLASPVRDLALMLSTLCDADPQHLSLARLAQRCADRTAWVSTQDTAWAVMALGKYLRIQRQATPYRHAELRIDGRDSGVTDVGGRLTWSGSSVGVIEALVAGDAGAQGFVSWLREGVPLKPPADADHGLEARREYLDERGQPIGDRPLISGELVQVRLSVHALVPRANVVLEDVLPAGLEVENPHLEHTAANVGVSEDREEASRVDIRDDRVVVFGDISAASRGKAGTLRLVHVYLARAVTAGTFIRPPVRAECLYDVSLTSTFGSGTLRVVSRP